jgi:hypothetical protein
MRNETVKRSLTQIIKSAIEAELPAILIQQKQEIIDAKGALNGREAWTPLSRQTIARKKKEGKPEPDAPLKGWGDLYEDFTADKTEESTNSLTFGIDNTAFGNDEKSPLTPPRKSGPTKYAYDQDQGFDENPWGIHTPARPFFDYTDGDLEEITKLLIPVIEKALKG